MHIIIAFVSVGDILCLVYNPKKAFKPINAKGKIIMGKISIFIRKKSAKRKNMTQKVISDIPKS